MVESWSTLSHVVMLNKKVLTELSDRTRENSKQSVGMASWLPYYIFNQMWMETDELKNNCSVFEWNLEQT